MEKFKVSFEANNQQLKSIGTKHASDTYADIEATFSLGEKWTDMDSVSAVWWNDFTRVATVLDSQGKCIVPHEVLTRKGCVRVNLVGSIVEGDELITRLTSYSAEAVQVNEKIKLTGSETSELTPSQFEQFVAQVIAEVEKVTGMTAVAETLPAGSPATASYSDGVLTLGIPQGIQGETGNGIASVSLNSDYTLTISMTDGTSYTTASIRGEKGEKGDTGERGPIGPQGETGQQGIQGEQGPKGDTGETGATPNLTIGTVETLAPTEDATATITGTAENPVLNLGLPKGDTGEVSLEDLEALLPTETASGEIVTIPDGQSIVPAKSLKVELDPIQDLHGYDKPWAGGAGANVAEPISGNVNGLTFTPQDDGTVKITGTVQVTTWTWLPTDMFELPYKGVSAGDSVVLYSDIQILLRTYDENGTLLQSIGASNEDWETVIIDANATKIIFYFYAKAATPQAGEVINTIAHFYVAKGSTFTAWSPYSNICPISGRTEVNTIVSPTTSASDGTTYTTSLGQTVYGGTLDVVSGELVVDRAMVDLGTLNWIYRSNLGGMSATLSPMAKDQFKAVCSIYPYGGAYYELADKQCGYVYDNQIFVKDNDYTDEAAFKTAMSGVQLCYELATPQTIQLTPQEVQLLLGTNNIWSVGEVTLTYNADIQKWVEKKLQS